MNEEADLKIRVAEMEKRLEKLEHCNHQWELAPNGNFRHYFNGCNAYILCVKCGKRSAC